MAVVGAVGSGKSSLLAALLGDIKKTRGKVPPVIMKHDIIDFLIIIHTPRAITKMGGVRFR